VKEVCDQYEVNGIVHLAAFKHARESMLNPSKYWINNVGTTLGLVEGIQGTKVSKVILSSSCSIYGNNSGVDEKSSDNPQSPYAHTKKVSEETLAGVLPTLGISFMSLRFFNVVGCDSFPQAHDSSDECLIPVITNQVLTEAPFKIFGDSHPTEDGTCVRDYLDVRDLARAHLIVASKLGTLSSPVILNVSSGKAISVLQVLREFEAVIGKEITYTSTPANSADPIAIWSQASKILANWGWEPKHNLKSSISSHWESVNKPPG
jgi:UDP-glucose 4-epimerase